MTILKWLLTPNTVTKAHFLDLFVYKKVKEVPLAPELCDRLPRKKMVDNGDVVITGNIVHCTAPFKIESVKGSITVRDGKIVAFGKLNNLVVDKGAVEINLKDSQILIPGLIDTHIHAPQYPNSGLGYDKPLLDWLDTYTYPTEQGYTDLEFSKKVYDAVVKKTLSYGTTTACYFGSLYLNSSLVLVDSVIEYGQRALVGKLNMITLAPDNYIESRKLSIDTTIEFINAVLSKKSELVKPIITPRFALSVDIELMQELASIAKEYDLHIQSHISENKDEVGLVWDTFQKNYATVYDEGLLLTPKTILAHGVYLTDSEVELLVKRGTSIAHCPESNTFLRSGMCDARRLIDARVVLGLGTDVSGGPSPSIITAMKSAIDTSIHVSFSKENYKPLTYSDAFYLGTLGGAKALSLQDEIGNFEIGKDFDALVVDMNLDNSSADYLKRCTPLELLQKFIFLGDNRNVIDVYVKGRKVK